LRPRGQHRAFQHLAPRQPQRRRAHQLDLGDRGLTETRDLQQQVVRRIHGLGESAEAGEERLGDGLGIPERHGAEQN
jgi:hypothetical protein